MPRPRRTPRGTGPVSAPPEAASRGAVRRVSDALVRALLRAGFPLLKLWWRFTHPTIEGVYVAVRCEGRVLLIRNSYRSVCSFPSGRRGRNEAPARAAARELREEVGLAVAPERLRHVAEVLHRTALVDDHVHVFELALDAEPALAIDQREVIWAAFETPERARERELLPIPRHYLEGTLGEIDAAGADVSRPS